MEMEHVLATNSVVAWARSCWTYQRECAGRSVEAHNDSNGQVEELQRARKLGQAIA